MHMDHKQGNNVPMFLEIQPDTRRRIEAAIESLVAILDELDGDPDLEPNFGFLGRSPAPEDVDLEGNDSDLEPWLGSPERPTVLFTSFSVDHGSSQLAWGGGPTSVHFLDLEDEHDGSEPSLGWTITGALGSDSDLELDRSDCEPDDTGIADHGGLAEQIGRSPYDRGVM